MKQLKTLMLAALLGHGLCTQTALASQFKLPEEIGRMEGTRDLNLFQLEPSVIHEHYYTSGQGERSQYVGNLLAPGAEIPDSDPAPKKANSAGVSAPATRAGTSGAAQIKDQAPGTIPAQSGAPKSNAK